MPSFRGKIFKFRGESLKDNLKPASVILYVLIVVP